MHPTRRDFLRSSALLACSPSVPLFLARSAAALAAAPADRQRILVVLELNGGNDGLNTVVPYRDDAYRKYRPKLHIPADRLHRIDDHVGLHPALRGFANLLDARRLAVVQSVGYPNPNRSHFESMAIWQSARLDAANGPGWFARCLDERPAAPGRDVPALNVGNTLLPEALAGGQVRVPSLASLDQFCRRLGVPPEAEPAQQRAALDQLARQERGQPGSLLQFVEQTAVLSYTSSARLEGLARAPAAVAYPAFSGLANRLRLIAQLIKAGLSTSIYYTQLSGFDTHANQLETHGQLLRDIGDGLKAFLDDVAKSGEGQRVLVLVFSEFGRRLAENASGGTDHGTAAPVFLLGESVKAGLHGPYPNLQDLDDGDPKHGLDFRRVYATLLERWLACPSAKVLGGQFAEVPIV